jgi:hypothetical protein
MITAMSSRRPSTADRRRRRMSTQQLILTIIGILVIAAFLLGLFANP